MGHTLVFGKIYRWIGEECLQIKFTRLLLNSEQKVESG